jgi:AraC-like DNA-binding protein
MQKKWLFRLILSYVPIFFVVVFCLMLVFFMGVGEVLRKQSMNAHRVYSEQVRHLVDSTLQNVDAMASRDLLLNPKIADYFDRAGEQSPYSYYGVTEALLAFTVTMPMVDSIYLYREADGKVLLQHYASELATFGDRAFLEQGARAEGPTTWSGVRTLRLFGDDRTSQVVSLTKKVPYYSGEEGLIVVNVRSSSLQSLVREMYDGGAGGAACLYDKGGVPLAGPGTACATKGEPPHYASTSPYTGWDLRIHLPEEGAFSFVSIFSYLWFWLGLLAVAIGIAAMTYISHRHYRPLEQVLSRIRTFGEKRAGLAANADAKDEFDFIDHALVSLIEQTNHFEERQAESLLFLRSHLFKELSEGTRRMTKEELRREFANLGLEGTLDVMLAVVVELDDYAGFASTYSHRDQSLFKFTVRSAIQEIAEEEGELALTEWMTPARLGVLYRMPAGSGERHMALKATRLSERAREWVERHLKFTVTCGVGAAVREPSEAAESFKQATAALERKISLGPNRVVVYDPQWRLMAEPSGADTLMQQLREAASLFRLGNPDWELLLAHAFDSIAAGVYSRGEVTGLLRMFKAQLLRDMAELPDNLREAWATYGAERLQAAPEEPEWAALARDELFDALRDADRELQKLRMNRESYHLAAQVREYIAEHYANPDLSLSHVSDAFEMNQKTLSRIFKEEFGEKFVDYLAKVRVERAKRLLSETSEPIQLIAEKIGYLYPMSFIRVFKKVEGITPGDYRKDAGAKQTE